MLVVALPVLFLFFFFAWKYRAGGQATTYEPNWDRNWKLSLFKWVFPGTIIAILAIITWHTSHALDPYKPIASPNPPLTIQVVALRWKWLFIYPGQNIATINFIEFPTNTPVHFELTADGPMNSFWIPQLGGQMYAMAGMVNQLNLMADEAGQFQGSAAEINGQGFAGMKFIAQSASETDFETWVGSVKKTSPKLSYEDYTHLVQPSENSPQASYSSTDHDLFAHIIMNYMAPMPDNSSGPDMSQMPGMNMQ